ncbi:unnamed protein product, partial [Didymodactylos carnosus]
ELELLEILNNQKINSDHNPMIYYRLSYLNKLRGNLQISMNYINLAQKKYYEKMNKKIFRQIEKFKSKLTILEKMELNFLEKNQMNLFQIFNVIMKLNLPWKFSITNGFQLYQGTSTMNNKNSLINCLFYHLIGDINDIEQYLNNHDDSLIRKYHELQTMCRINPTISRKKLIDSFNEKFQIQFKCLFIGERNDIEEFQYRNGQIPIVLFRDEQSNN